MKIITGDRDLLQLVDDRIIVNLAGSKLSEAKDYSAPDVLAYLGVRPDQVVDYKALVGDTSDNIPGVTGIGEKTAITLLGQYDTLDEIYAHLDELPTRVRTNLETGRESAYLSHKLATIRTDLHLTLDLEQARTDHINFAAVEALFRELEFRTLTNRLLTLKRGYNPPLAAAADSAPGQQLSLFGEPVTARLASLRPSICKPTSFRVKRTWPICVARPGLRSGDRLRYRNHLHRPAAGRPGGHFAGRSTGRGVLHPGRPHHRRAAAAAGAGARCPAPGADRPARSPRSATT